jgi:hypothetical protein
MGGQDLVAKFDVSTYSKILLHGAKHPTSPVIGLLLGSRSGSEVLTNSHTHHVQVLVDVL